MSSIRLLALASTVMLCGGAAHAKKAGRVSSIEYAGSKHAMRFTLNTPAA